MMNKKVMDYFKKNPMYNAVIHAIGGIGIGVLIASPFANPHPVRVGLAFLAIAIFGHLYPVMMGKK